MPWMDIHSMNLPSAEKESKAPRGRNGAARRAMMMYEKNWCDNVIMSSKTMYLGKLYEAEQEK